MSSSGSAANFARRIIIPDFVLYQPLQLLPLWLQTLYLLLDFLYILLYLFDGLHGAFPVFGVGDAHGLAGFLVHQLYGAQVELAVDDVEGVGADEAEVGINGDVVEVQGPVPVVEGAGNAVEGDETVEAAA